MLTFLRRVPGKAWAILAAVGGFLLGLFLLLRPRRQKLGIPAKAEPLERKIDRAIGAADRIEEERAEVREERAAVGAKIEAVKAESAGMSAEEIAADFNRHGVRR